MLDAQIKTIIIAKQRARPTCGLFGPPAPRCTVARRADRRAMGVSGARTRTGAPTGPGELNSLYGRKRGAGSVAFAEHKWRVRAGRLAQCMRARCARTVRTRLAGWPAPLGARAHTEPASSASQARVRGLFLSPGPGPANLQDACALALVHRAEV